MEKACLIVGIANLFLLILTLYISISRNSVIARFLELLDRVDDEARTVTAIRQDLDRRTKPRD